MGGAQNEVVIRVEELPEVQIQSIGPERESGRRRRRRRRSNRKPASSRFRFAAGPNEQMLFVAQKYWLIALSALLNVVSVTTWIESAAGRDAFLCVVLVLFASSLFFRSDVVSTKKRVYWCQTVVMLLLIVYFVATYIVHRIDVFNSDSGEDQEDVLLLTFPIMSWLAAAILVVLARLLCHAHY